MLPQFLGPNLAKFGTGTMFLLKFINYMTRFDLIFDVFSGLFRLVLQKRWVVSARSACSTF